MLNAIGSSSYSDTPSAGASSAALEAQLAQCERQLADNVNCSSAKTAEGKNKIQTLTNRIGAIKARLEKTVTAKSDSPSASLEVKTPANRYGDTAAPKPANGGVGSLVDVFA